jgi:hypothetical protein
MFVPLWVAWCYATLIPRLSEITYFVYGFAYPNSLLNDLLTSDRSC